MKYLYLRSSNDFESFFRTDLGFTEEELSEHKRIALEYRRNTIRYNNKVEKDIATKIWLMHEALRSLPPNLRGPAEIIDESPPPPDRPVGVFDTPPIKDFDPSKFSSADSSEDALELAAADDIFDPSNDDNVLQGKFSKKDK